MRKILKILFGLILLLVLVIGGFALGVYLRLFDTQALNDAYGLHQLPVVGEYFVPPTAGKEHTETAAASTAAQSAGSGAPNAAAGKKTPETVKISKEEIKKQQAEREAADKKRVTKLVHLYNDMKAENAAQVMETLDTDLCAAILQGMDESKAAKILASFDPARAAEITQLIYNGVSQKAKKARSADRSAGAPGTEPGEGSAEIQ